MNKYKTISFSEFERKSGSDWSADSDYSRQSWYRRGLEKSSKKRGCKSCKKSCDDGFCSFKNCSEYSPQAIAKTIPVMHHEKHRECFKKFSFLVDSNDDRKAFQNYLHHPKCYETKCHEDCCLSGLSKVSSSCSSSSSSSSGCPQKSSSSSSSSSDQIELLYALFLDFIKAYNNRASLSGASENKIIKEKVLKISIEKMPAGDVMVVEGKVKDGKRGSRINPTLSVRVGERICFDVMQYAGGKHQFALFAKGSAVPLAGSPVPLQSGKMCYNITADTPKSFQYGALDDPSLSGIINVIA